MSAVRHPLVRLAALAALFTSGMACEYGSASGDRALSGECPEKTCSDETPSGLIFYGQTLYDDEADRMGPVARGGTFLLRFDVPDGVLGGWDVEVEPSGILEVTRTGTRSMVVEGIGAGDAMIRVVNSETGELYDRLPFRGVGLAGVEVGNAKNTRDFLVAGCSEMVGIDIFHDDGRAFDMNVEMFIDGELVPERWDCYSIDVPVGIDELEFVVHAGSEDHSFRMPVVQGDCLSIYE
jgi:hypothetical protein